VLEINFIIQLFTRPITILKHYYFTTTSTQTSLLIRPIALVIKLMTCNNIYNLLPKRRQHIEFGWQVLSTKANVQCMEIDMFVMKNQGIFWHVFKWITLFNFTLQHTYIYFTKFDNLKKVANESRWHSCEELDNPCTNSNKSRTH
jgi:hypothetical protein